MKTSKENYFKHIESIGIKNLPEKIQKAHEYIVRATSNGSSWALYAKNEKIKEVIDKQFLLIDDFLKNHEVKKGAAPAREKKTPDAKEPKEIVREESQPDQPTIKTKHLPVHLPGKAVETLDPHLVLLGQYLNISKKQVPITRVIAFARRLVRQINGRILRKNSNYAPLIEKMKKNIMNVIRTTKGALAMVEIAAGERRSIEKVMQDEHKMKSVQLLSQYAGQAEKTTTIEKAKRLYNSMHNAIEKGEVPESDRYFDQIIESMKKLKAYVEKDNESNMLPLLPSELSGILGCGCMESDSDGELHGVSEADPEQPSYGVDTSTLVTEEGFSADDIRALSEMTCVKDDFNPVPADEFVKKSKFENGLKLGEPLGLIFGDPLPGCLTMIHGLEKFGKSSLLISLGERLAEMGRKVLMIAHEEGLDATLKQKLEMLQAKHPNFHLEDALPKDMSLLLGYNDLLIDSITDAGITPAQLAAIKKFLKIHRMNGYGVFHSTKTGKARGSNTYGHLVDQIVNVCEFGTAIGRGRFKGATGQKVRFAEPFSQN